MKNIAQLRREGYKVRVLHSRPIVYQQKIDGSVKVFSPTGGKTTIQITTPEGRDVVGEATCSDKDSWNRKFGNQIALGRALAKL
jgi:hypothetical protein